MDTSHDIVDLMIYEPGARLLVAATNGKGFIVEQDDVVAQTKSGKQILNVSAGVKAAVCREAKGDHIAVIGDNRKLLIFKAEELPMMKRGQGITLQKYKGSSLVDAKAFALKDGLTWKSGDRIRTETDITPWLGHRGGQGKLPPTGFPRTNRFD